MKCFIDDDGYLTIDIPDVGIGLTANETKKLYLKLKRYYEKKKNG